ncbi:unnamed protein product [Spodoptera littoralis]|uniref:Cyclic nucleotide-binding domain-containing protein n=1 Tax=Spodoptera littoralis TaxID=7109 RepID=A0A9P0IEZ6_SPOLI|nr:unnamed protein product [Spodoptera littoralis]CAH1645596.1 unnamed protein product [Spodoptera littoralis]
MVLRRTDFMRVIVEHPAMYELIKNKIDTRLKSAKTRQEAIENYDKGDSRLIRTRYRPMKVLKDKLTGAEEEDPTFVDDSHMYYRDENNERQPKFTTEFLELYQMSSNVTTIDAPHICLRSNFPWILIPDTDFNHHSDTEKVLGTIVVAAFLINIYMQLTTATYEDNVLKETVKEIAEVKMASFGFYLDIVSVFPVSIFTDTMDPQGETVAGQIAMLFPILQVWHIWHYINKWAKNFNSHTKNSWMSQLIYWETKVFMTNEARHESPLKTSFLFGTSVFTGTGSSEVMFLYVLGAYLSCFYTANICSNYLLSTQRKLKFKESMRELFYFLSVNHVSGKIKARVKKFFCVQWYYNRAVSTQEIFSDMSSNIQQDVLSIEMVRTLDFCPLFQVLNRDFLQTVASNTRKLILPDNEVVQHAGDIGRDMYILKNALADENVKKLAVAFEDAKPLIGRLDTKTNRIANSDYIKGDNWIDGTCTDDLIKVDVDGDIGSDICLRMDTLIHVRYIFMPGCITPHGLFLKFWCAVRFVVAVFYIFAVPYDIATQSNAFGAIMEYLYTFYWVFELFVGLGCPPVNMTSSVDLWMMMVLQLAGFLYFAFMFGYVASTRTAAAHALLEHNEKTKDLANFLYQENVDPMLTVKTLKYFEYVWKRTNGSNPQRICRHLNSALMEDTLVFMYERALREVPLFGKVERSFIRVITQHLHEMYFLRGDTVIQCRDIQPYIFIIYRGKTFLLRYKSMFAVNLSSQISLEQPISCSEVTIYASRSLDLLVIPSVTFFNLIKYYPKIHEPLNKAFEMSRDYILPINMEMDDDDSSEDESTLDILSMESGGDSKSGSSRFDLSGSLPMSSASQSNLSQSKSSASVSTYHSYSHASNLLRPGTLMFQSYGYVTCTAVTIHYVVGLYDLVTLNDCAILFWIHALLDIYFYCKVYLSMHQGYISRHGELILDGSKCRHRYFKHKMWPWTDLLVNFPLEFFGFGFPETPQIRWDYVTSIYVIVAQLTTTGSDEFVVDEKLPMVILAVVLVCGKMLAAIVVAASIQLAYSTKYALTAYEKATRELIDMLKNQGLSDYQLQKFWKYIQQLWVTERGRQLPLLISQTPYVRRCDLMSAMFGHHLRNCYIFAETGESLLRQLTVALDYTIFFPGNYIVVAGDSEARMYWVASGTVSVVSVRADLTEITHELLGPGDVFGILQGMNRGISHCFSYRAETKVSILTLSLDSWINILPFFPEAKKMIMERSEVLFTQIG